MAAWKNLDTLASYGELSKLKNHVDIAEAMSGAKGAERVAKYSVPMAAGLNYNYAAKEVDETVLAALEKLANEAELSEKFEELYNGAVINTGENRMVLHHLARVQLGKAVVADGVDKREFYVAQQKKAADFANKVHAGEITNENGEKFTTVVQIGIAEVILVLVLFISHLRTGQRQTTPSRWKQSSSAMLIQMTQQQF